VDGTGRFPLKRIVAVLGLVAALVLPTSGIAQADELKVGRKVGGCTLTVLTVGYDPQTGTVYYINGVSYVCT
jgi:hypothetical protein